MQVHLRRFRPLLLLLLAQVFTILGATPFPEPYDTDPPDHVPISADAAAASFRLPDGFRVSVFAAEPDVRQPISLTTDPRGRLWVVENFTYADAKAGFATNLSDRILIFADTNHDGRFDQRTVFWDEGKLVTSAEPGPGGVYVMAPPRLLFIPDRNGDDIPDGEPEVLLDGFNTTTGSRHTFANGLKWGPDGWLWGRVGISSTAKAGRPGAPDNERVLMAGGIWRYHPGRRVVEAVAQGTTNPWGLDWNELGEPFFINTVIGHLWHAIPGAHFQRMYGEDPDPHSYDLIAQHADHFHFDTGAGWTKSRAALDGSAFASGSDSLGGGHAHSGLLFYLGTNWPSQYRDRLFTINLHGRRANQERIQREGLGFVGRHEADLFSVGDPWFRGLDLVQGPDGGVYVTDWSDTGECHDQDGIHRGSGRIYKITYGTPPAPAIGDLEALNDTALVALVADPNEWLSRQSRRVLVNRRASGKAAGVVSQLAVEFGRQRTTPGRLRAIWALHAVGGARPEWLLERISNQTRDANEYIRSWAVRLLADDVWPRGARPPSPAIQARTVDAFLALAQSEPSNSIVRLYLASALQHLPLDARASLASALLQDPGAAADHNQGYLIWYGMEDLVAARPDTAVELAISGKLPLIRKNVARWLAEDIEKNPGTLDLLLAKATPAPPEAQQDVVRGMSEALKGWRKAPAPRSWSQFAAAASTSGDAAHRDRVRDLTILFGDGRALEDLRALALNDTAPALNRRAALRTLIESRAPNLEPLLRQLSNDPVLRTPAMVALIQSGDTEAARTATGRYPWLDAPDRASVLAALASRPAAAGILLDGVVARQVPKGDLTPFLARQIAGLNDTALSNRLSEVWGSVRSSDASRRSTVDRFRSQMTPEHLAGAHLPQGRLVFSQLCVPCHRLYGEGAEIGPDLTGSGRSQLDYLLENLVDPSAVVPADYRMVTIHLKDGRVLNGILRKQTDRIVTLQTQGELSALERSEISLLEPSQQSMMPEGMLESLSPDQARDLLAYLMSPKQVALPAAP